MENIILYNSRELFYEQGYFKTKISHITKKCGISTGKFYRCYNSKEDLLFQIIKKDLKVYTEEVRTLVPEVGDDIFKLKMIIRSIFNFLKKNPFFFALLIELKENDEKLSIFSRKYLNSFWNETKMLVMELQKHNEHFDKDKGELLTSMMESQVKIYIRYLLSEKNGKCSPEKLLFLSMEDEVNSISTVIINTFESLNGPTAKKTIDPLTGAYTNRYFFELLKKTHNNGKSFNLIFLDLKTFYITEDTQKKFFRDNIIANTGSLLKKKFRSMDLIGRLDPSKFIILVLTEDVILDTLNFRVVRIVEELKIKFPCISSEDIVWKHLYINSKEDVCNKFNELKSIKYNNIINFRAAI